MERVDYLVVGAGVVGLAIARELQRSGCQTVVVERQPQFGMEISSRNSEVIHAGIYYAPGSLKARLCVRGNRLLYDYCVARGVPHRRLGKLIVATNAAERERLVDYRARALANGVDDLRLIDSVELAEMEPAVSACAALLSPSSGIVDSHALMAALAADFEMLGGTLVFRADVVSVTASAAGTIVTLADGYAVLAERFINSAGLQAPTIAGWCGVSGFGGGAVRRYCKGHYYHYAGAAPFTRLVYPVAVAGGLGVHVTLDMAGQLRFGPDVRWVDALSYEFDDSRRQEFIAAIRRYYPELDAARLVPGYTGIRPKLAAEGAADADFLVRLEPVGRGLAVHLLGIESPGLTAALAIAEQVADYLV